MLLNFSSKYLALAAVVFWGAVGGYLPFQGSLSIYPWLVFLFVISYGVWKQPNKQRNFRFQKSYLFIYFIYIYVFIKYLNKSFLAFTDVESFIDNAVELQGKGRGIWDLLDLVMSYSPIVWLVIQKNKGLVIFVIYLLLCIPFVGISRGLAVFYLVIFFSHNKSLSLRSLLIASLSLYVFVYSLSVARDGYSTQGFSSNPVSETVLAPALNSELLEDYVSIRYTTYDYISQVFLKPIPSFLIDKKLLSTNLIFTEALYGDIKAVSVFTYIPEIYRFGNPFLQAVLLGLFFVFCMKVLNYFGSNNSLFMLTFNLVLLIYLRSRFLDVFTHVLALLLVIIIYRILYSYEKYLVR